jgi:hypothetical protein
MGIREIGMNANNDRTLGAAIEAAAASGIHR